MECPNNSNKNAEDSNIDNSVVYVTRHGARIDSGGPDSDYNWLKKVNHNRSDDPHLSKSGEMGAKELAERMSSTEIPKIQHIVSSPYIRCIQTAIAVATLCNLSVKVEPGIAEVQTQRPPPGILPTKEIAEQFNTSTAPIIDTNYIPVMEISQLKYEGSDSIAANRAKHVAQTIRSKVVGPILFVGHGASCLGLVEAFGGSGYIGYTSLSKFTFNMTSRLWTPVPGIQGDVSHLSDKETSLRSAF